VRVSGCLESFIVLFAFTLFVLSFDVGIGQIQQELTALSLLEVCWFLQPACLPPTVGRVYLRDCLLDSGDQ